MLSERASACKITPHKRYGVRGMTWAIFVTSQELGYLLDKARKEWAEKMLADLMEKFMVFHVSFDTLGFKASISHSQHGAK